jgi:protein-S-isoprenylcysteine O-methyltransferase Ste14
MSTFQVHSKGRSEGGTINIPDLRVPPQLIAVLVVVGTALFLAFLVNASVSEQVRTSVVWVWVTAAIIVLAACIGLWSYYVSRKETKDEKEYRDRLDRVHEEGNRKFDDLFK